MRINCNDAHFFGSSITACNFMFVKTVRQQAEETAIGV